MKRVLLTGAAGFIGKHVLYQLTTLGYEIVAVVRNHDQASQLRGLATGCLVKTIDPNVSWSNELAGIDAFNGENLGQVGCGGASGRFAAGGQFEDSERVGMDAAIYNETGVKRNSGMV